MLKETEILTPRAKVYSLQSHGSSSKPLSIGVFILNMKATTGIYMIQSISNLQRCYIGSSVHIEQRKNIHIKDLRLQKHHSFLLQDHYNKYGEDDLCFSTLIGCDRIDLLRNEQFFIDLYNPYFNISKIAGSPLGCKHSVESRRKQSLRNKGLHISPHTEFKKGHIPWGKGKPLTPEFKKKISESWNNNKKQRCENISKAKMGQQSFLGKTHSNEAKLKMSLAKKGKVMSLEVRKKMSLAKIGNKNSVGRKWSEEKREAMRLCKTGNKDRLGKLHTSETKLKMHLSQIKRHAEKKLRIIGKQIKE